MSKKALITLSLIGTALYSTDLMSTVLAETNTPSALFERSIVKTATTTENLNLRDKASTSGAILITIPKGNTVTLLSDKSSNGWYQVSYEGKIGYASGTYLQENVTNATSLGQTTENLNLRQQANTNGSILAIIPKGETITLLSDKDANGWYQVSYLDKTGYVYGDYITKISQGSNSSNTTPSTSTPIEGQTTENLNLRQQANTSASILTTIPKGTTIQVLADKDSNGWYKVNYSGKIGYVSSSYLTITKYSTPEVVKQTGYVYNLNGTLLNVRPKPSTSQAAIGTLSEGKTVVIIGETGNWYEIEFNGSTAYVSKDYISLTAPTPEVVKQTGYVYNLNGTLLNVRPQPSTSQAAIGTLSEGKTVVIIGETGNWYEIEFNGSTAYVSKDYISLSAPTPEVVKQTGYVYNLNGTLLNVRPQPSTSQAAIGKLSEGETVVIIGETGNWYEIEFNGSTAYVSKDYVTLTAPQLHPDANIDFATTPRTGVVIDGISSLNVRQAATTTSSILGTLTAKNEVTVIGREGDFYKIIYHDSSAYVHKDYVGIKASSTTLNGRVSYLTTDYSYTLSQFAQIQQNYTSGTLSTIMNYLNPNHTMHTNYLLQYLRVDQFRSFNVNGLNQFLKNKGVLHNQAQAIFDAAKHYNIDPIFFVSQSIHETNWGSSSLAKGITITDIADETKPIKNANGKVVDYERIQLPEPVTVYNLFGIGAQDHAPRLLGTTYAYKRGWTTPEKAIFGAAEFVSLNYINSSKYEQNTPFKIKYNQLSANQWHQYATTPWYAYEIAKYMHQFSHLYDAGQEFLLDIPVYKK